MIVIKANELFKKEIGTDFNNITNKEKAIIVSALKSDYKITELLLILKLKKSTFYYEIKHLNEDKYKDIRMYIKTIFKSNYMCYGYRRMKELC